MSKNKENNMRETYCENCGDKRFGDVTFNEKRYPVIVNATCKKCGVHSLRLKSEIDNMLREFSDYEVELELMEEDARKAIEEGIKYGIYLNEKDYEW